MLMYVAAPSAAEARIHLICADVDDAAAAAEADDATACHRNRRKLEGWMRVDETLPADVL